MRDKTSPREMMLWFFLALFLASFFLLGWVLWPFLSVLVLASVVTGIFNPVFNRLKMKIKPSLASFITCTIIFIILFIPIVVLVGILSQEAYALYLTAKGAVLSDQVNTFLATSQLLEKSNAMLSNFHITISNEDLNAVITESGKKIGLFLFQQANAIASNVFNFLIYFFFMLLIIYFLLIDQQKLVAFIIDLSPLPEDQNEKLMQKFKDIAGAVLIGNGFCGLIQGILGGTVFALFGLKSPFLWGVMMGLLAFLPILGIGAVLIPAAFFLFIKGRIAAAIFFIVFYVVLSGGVEYILKPKLVGHRVKMHTLLVFLTIIGGLKLFGILGIIYGPLIVTAFLTLTEIYHSSYQTYIDPGVR